MSRSENLLQELNPLIANINNHSLYQNIRDLADLRIFMQHHVFAVWDFMCLLKTLHGKVVCTQAPWFPPIDAESAHLISRILVEEEGDILPDGQNYKSHFEIYLASMNDVGADPKVILQLLQNLSNRPNTGLQDALNEINVSDSIKQFVQTTFSFFDLTVHEVAAAFVFGREAITQIMFQPMLVQLQDELPPSDQTKMQLLQYYLNRHIALDSEEHFPKALQMLTRLCGNDELKWEQAKNAAEKALRARLQFLTAIQETIEGCRSLCTRC